MAYQPELIGGHVALDLLNTISWRLDPIRTIDRIATPETLAIWRAAVGLEQAARPSGAEKATASGGAADAAATHAARAKGSAAVGAVLPGRPPASAAEAARLSGAVGEAAGAASECERVAAVREVVYRALAPVARGLAAADQSELQRLLVGALGRATPLGVRPLDWVGVDLVDELVMAAGRLVEREDLGRLRECAGAGCGWLFLDRSKNGSRRWCSSGDCGNRARAKRHYQRLHPGTGGLL